MGVVCRAGTALTVLVVDIASFAFRLALVDTGPESSRIESQVSCVVSGGNSEPTSRALLLLCFLFWWASGETCEADGCSVSSSGWSGELDFARGDGNMR